MSEKLTSFGVVCVNFR